MIGFPTGLSQNNYALIAHFFWGKFKFFEGKESGFSGFFYCYILEKNKIIDNAKISIYKDAWIIYFHILCIAKFS
jgi:hypothetical protein